VVLREDKIGQELLVPQRLTDLIPKDHICYFIEKVINEIDFSEYTKKYKNNPGCKSI
jgi:hypothetical protein